MKKQSPFLGTAVAHLLFSSTLRDAQPASNYAFSELEYFQRAGHYMGVSRCANFLCIARDEEEAMRIAQLSYIDAEYRGILTSENYLLAPGTQALKVVGPHIDITNIASGPIERKYIPRAVSARPAFLRIASSDGTSLKP